MKKTQPESNARRGFLKATASIGAGAAATTLLPSAVLASESEAKDRGTAKRGYQVTEHVIDYYKSAAL